MEAEPNSRYHHLKSTLLVVLLLYLLYRVSVWLYKAYRIRLRYHDIPSLPRHPIWGNLVNAGQRLNPALKRHPDYGFEEIWREMGEPGCFLVDLAPVEDRGFLVIAEPQYVEAVVNPSEDFRYSTPKSNNYKPLKPLLGAESIITKEGSDWRATRKRFNPGFQPKYVHSLTGPIVTRVKIFVDRLQELAKTDAIFRMADYSQDLTLDIITQLAIAKDLKAQSTPEGQGEKSTLGLLTVSRRLSELVYAVGQGIGLHMIDPIRPIKLFIYQSIYDHKLAAIVKERLRTTTTASEARSIIQLAVCDIPSSKALIRTCVDQIKSFLFAGQDTTATTIQWFCYEMSKASHDPRHATYLKRLRQEHDAVFGPGQFSALEFLSSSAAAESESIVTHKLPYTTAFIKETLRLHPPAATVRAVPWEATSVSLSLPTHDVCIAGLQIYPSIHLIHRNHNVWGEEAHLFNPDRWLDEAYVAKLPPGAYRPFERGPRNCIGQELAMLEAMVVLSSVARAFAFEKVGLTGRATTDGGKVEKEVWSDHAVTSVPVDGMVMRVSMTGKA